MALTLSFDNLDTPIFPAMRCTLRVLVPVAYISAPAATSARSRYPFLLFAPPPQSRSASASITALTICSASLLKSSCMSMAPSSNLGMQGMSGIGSAKIPIAIFVLSQSLLLW